jgi:hypothetical protein
MKAWLIKPRQQESHRHRVLQVSRNIQQDEFAQTEQKNICKVYNPQIAWKSVKKELIEKI